MASYRGEYSVMPTNLFDSEWHRRLSSTSDSNRLIPRFSGVSLLGSCW